VTAKLEIKMSQQFAAVGTILWLWNIKQFVSVLIHVFVLFVYLSTLCSHQQICMDFGP